MVCLDMKEDTYSAGWVSLGYLMSLYADMITFTGDITQLYTSILTPAAIPRAKVSHIPCYAQTESHNRYLQTCYILNDTTV